MRGTTLLRNLIPAAIVALVLGSSLVISAGAKDNKPGNDHQCGYGQSDNDESGNNGNGNDQQGNNKAAASADNDASCNEDESDQGGGDNGGGGNGGGGNGYGGHRDHGGGPF